MFENVKTYVLTQLALLWALFIGWAVTKVSSKGVTMAILIVTALSIEPHIWSIPLFIVLIGLIYLLRATAAHEQSAPAATLH